MAQKTSETRHLGLGRTAVKRLFYLQLGLFERLYAQTVGRRLGLFSRYFCVKLGVAALQTFQPSAMIV